MGAAPRLQAGSPRSAVGWGPRAGSAPAGGLRGWWRAREEGAGRGRAADAWHAQMSRQGRPGRAPQPATVPPTHYCSRGVPRAPRGAPSAQAVVAKVRGPPGARDPQAAGARSAGAPAQRTARRLLATGAQEPPPVTIPGVGPVGRCHAPRDVAVHQSWAVLGVGSGWACVGCAGVGVWLRSVGGCAAPRGGWCGGHDRLDGSGGPGAAGALLDRSDTDRRRYDHPAGGRPCGTWMGVVVVGCV